MFEEVGVQRGLIFQHDSGSKGEFVMPEHIGSGAAWLDYDNDGRLDVYLVQCGGAGSGSRNQLFQQQTDGSFRDSSVGSGLDVEGVGMGVTAGDINNDGLVDLFLTEYGNIRLFLNQGQGRFIDVTRVAGIDNARWSTAASFIDYDRDGWLDLVIGNYVDYNPTQQCYDPAGQPDFCGPQNFQNTVSRLFRNRGPVASAAGVAFEDTTVSSGFARAQGKSLGILCADFDGDRWPDIFVADDGVPNRLYLNQRNGTIRRGSAHAGTPLPGLIPFWFPYAQAYQLFLNDGQGHFVNVSELNPAFCGFVGVGRGLAKADFDNDGAIDLLAICAGGPAQLFRNVASRRGHWLTVRALDPALGNRDAIGAEVIVETGDRRYWRLIQPSCSYLVSNDPRAHFGLGAASHFNSILVLWPDGLDERFPGGSTDVHLVLRRGTGQSP